MPELNQTQKVVLDELFEQWDNSPQHLGALINKISELKQSNPDGVEAWLNQHESPNEQGHLLIERIISDIYNGSPNVSTNFSTEDIVNVIGKLQALNLNAIQTQLNDFKEGLEEKFDVNIIETQVLEQVPPNPGLSSLVTGLRTASRMARAFLNRVSERMESEDFNLEQMNQDFEEMVEQVPNEQHKKQIIKQYAELTNQQQRYGFEQAFKDTAIPIGEEDSISISDSLNEDTELGIPIINQGRAEQEEEAVLELAQQPSIELTPNEVIEKLNMGCRTLTQDQFNEFQGLYKPTSPKDFMGMMSDALCATDLGKNLKGHDIEDIATQSELSMLGAKQWVIQMRDELGQNRNEVEQQQIEAALQQYQQADQIHNFIKSVRSMARADTMMHEAEAQRRLDDIFPDPAVGSKEALLKQRLLEISQQVKHKQVYEPPGGEIGYANPKEKGLGKKRHIVYDDDNKPKLGSHSNFTMKVREDGHIQAKVFFDVNEYRKKGSDPSAYFGQKGRANVVKQMEKTVTQLIEAAINEQGLGSEQNPFEITLYEPKNYELALVTLTKIKEKAMLEGKEFYMKVPDPANPGNTKTITITPDKEVSPEFKQYFSDMAKNQSDVKGSKKKAQHFAGHYFFVNENHHNNLYDRKEGFTPDDFGEMFQKHIERRHDKLHNQCEKRVEAAIDSQQSVVENQQKAEVKEAKKAKQSTRH